jgi:excisionase family DNA binding protein
VTISWASGTREQLLTIKETAGRLRCSESHVYRLIATGKLRVTDVALPGSRRPKSRVSESDLAACIKDSADAGG